MGEGGQLKKEEGGGGVRTEEGDNITKNWVKGKCREL